MGALRALAVSLFAASLLGGCENEPNSPEPEAGNLYQENLYQGSFLEHLPDGAHILALHNGTNLLAIKDKVLAGDGTQGYGGMTQIDQDFVPQRPPDRTQDGMSVWHVLERDLVETLDDGIYQLTIPGSALNGEDLELIVLKDKVLPGDGTQGYLAIEAVQDSPRIK